MVQITIVYCTTPGAALCSRYFFYKHWKSCPTRGAKDKQWQEKGKHFINSNTLQRNTMGWEEMNTVICLLTIWSFAPVHTKIYKPYTESAANHVWGHMSYRSVSRVRHNNWWISNGHKEWVKRDEGRKVIFCVACSRGHPAPAVSAPSRSDTRKNKQWPTGCFSKRTPKCSTD